MLALSLSLALAMAPGADVYALSDAEFEAQAKADAQALKRYDEGLKRVASQLDGQKGLFNKKGDKPYSPEQKQTLLSAWASTFDYVFSAELIRQRYWNFMLQAPTSKRHAWGFALTHGALTTELAHGLSFADRAAFDKRLEVVLDEPAPEHGLPPRAFEQFKLKVIHVSTSTQLLTGDAYGLQLLPVFKELSLLDDADVKSTLALMKANSKTAKKSLLSRGPTFFAKNAVDLAKDGAMGAIFPVQKDIAEKMGDTRVYRKGKPLIARAQIDELLKKMEPGDVVVTRQNWFLSNIGLPGFWPHAELYLSTPAELTAYFDADAEVKAYLSAQSGAPASFADLLAKRFPDKWKQYGGKDDHGDPIRIMEAISEGVSFTGVEHGMHNDYLGVIRPRLSKLEKAKAVLRAFEHQGKPYDFDFDFFSDGSLVCTELVYKSYLPGKEQKGLSVPLVDVAGRKTLPANEFVRVFDAEFGKPDRQFDFVAFLDGREDMKAAVSKDAEAFRQTYRRVKWDVAQK